MQKIILYLLLAFTVGKGGAQHYYDIDSLKQVLHTQPVQDTIYAGRLLHISNLYYRFEEPDSSLSYSEQAYKLSTRLNYEAGIFGSLIADALAYAELRNDSMDLQKMIVALKMAEANGKPAYLCTAYLSFGVVYVMAADYDRAFEYFEKTRPLLGELDYNYSLNFYVYMASCYSSLDLADSAFYYTSKYITLSTKHNIKSNTGDYLMGRYYYQTRHFAVALQLYRQALQSRDGNDTHIKSAGAIYAGMAHVFIKTAELDSAALYAHYAYSHALQHNKPRSQAEATSLLAHIFEQLNKHDSAFIYLKQTSLLQDSLVRNTQLRAIHEIAFAEQMRQLQIQQDNAKAAEERKHNLQLTLITVIILVALIIFLLLSRSILVSHRFIEFLGVTVFLVVFEFINLLLHGVLQKITHHSPIYMLLGLVAIAALFVPLHHKLEKWATNKVIEKNKAIKLAHAQKTLEELKD